VKPVELSGKEREYLKEKNNELETNINNNNIRNFSRGINELQKGYQPTTNFVKYDNDNLLADTHNNFNRWSDHFCQLLNTHAIHKVRHTEMQTDETSLSEPSPFDVDVDVEKLKEYQVLTNSERTGPSRR
jgi:CHASE1-domain containing sensor protein